MSDKETLKLLFEIFFTLKTKSEADAQSFAILSTIEIFGYYNKPLSTSKNEHIRKFKYYIETLGVSDKNTNEIQAENIMKEILLIL